MDEAIFFDTMRQGLWIAVATSLPILSVALGAGLIVGLFQALTSIQEMTLTFVPKIIAVFAALVLLFPYMGTQLAEFFQNILDIIVATG